jgi:hypothetical protein
VTADEGDAEGGMIDVGVARDEDNVAFFPAALFHFAAGHGERGGKMVEG